MKKNRKEPSMTKNLVRTLLISTALAVTASAQTIQVNQNNRTIAVTVTDKATAAADIATVHIGFEAYAPDSDSAYAAGSKISNAIIDALHKAGINDKAIESDSQNLQRNDQFDEKEPELERAQRRFVLSQTWKVKTSAANAAKVLHIAVEAGANSSGQIDWDVKDRAALEAQAAAKALQHAHAVAEQMAKGLNAHLGSLLYASNQQSQPPVIFDRLQSFAKLQAPPPLPLAINPQKIEQSATVYAIFAIE
jgi:uncharacterized protein YggE